ncbi:hypothetical protein VOLCADRAFT_116284, partial [Volvox carteri f. nagariensis]
DAASRDFSSRLEPSGSSSNSSNSNGDDSDGGGSGTLTAGELRVKLSLAASSGRLDLTDCRLRQLPEEVLQLTELEELQLSGNCLTELPDSLSRLTALRRLGLAGNQLTQLPPGVGALTGLEGLWLHGNLIRRLPEQLGRLGGLRALSLAGNCLQAVPPGSLRGLTSLTDLTLAGNRLRSLPPGELEPLTRLRKLALNGNRLGQEGEEEGEEEEGEGTATATATSWLGVGSHMTGLTELMLQGNCLKRVDPAIFECPALQELSLADNQLTELPPNTAAATSLTRLHLFGNRLTRLSPRQLAGLPSLASCWLEGNPLSGDVVRQLISVAASASRSGDSSGGVGGGGEGGIVTSNEVLVVAFGSAPGTPNWGGLLGKVYRSAAAAGDEGRYFDVLYVADPSRDWYGGGDDSVYGYYRTRLLSYTRHYRRVLLLGDSMGASAALLFADLATAVLAFCPQVDLTAASIRPGRQTEWLTRFRRRLEGAVRSSRGELSVLRGWGGGGALGNGSGGEGGGGVTVKVFSVDSHRLAAALDARGQLVPLVRDAIRLQLGLRSGNVLKMFSCFGPSKLEGLQHEIDSLKLLLQTKDGELDRMRRQDLMQKQKEEQQTETLQAAAAHVAQLEARLMEQQRTSKELEVQLRLDYERKLTDAAQQRIALEGELENSRQRLAEQQLLAEQTRLQLEEMVAAQEQKLESLKEDGRLAELQRKSLEARLLEEHQKLDRLAQQHNVEQSKLLRRLANEEHRARRFQKQIANFTETMEEVSNILTAVENDQKTITSPVKVDKKAKASVAADHLRQSIAFFKCSKDEQPTDQGVGHSCT